MSNNISQLNNKIIKCRLCTRLINFRKKILKKKGNSILMNNIGENLLQVLVI